MENQLHPLPPQEGSYLLTQNLNKTLSQPIDTTSSGGATWGDTFSLRIKPKWILILKANKSFITGLNTWWD